MAIQTISFFFWRSKDKYFTVTSPPSQTSSKLLHTLTPLSPPLTPVSTIFTHRNYPETKSHSTEEHQQWPSSDARMQSVPQPMQKTEGEIIADNLFANREEAIGQIVDSHKQYFSVLYRCVKRHEEIQEQQQQHAVSCFFFLSHILGIKLGLVLYISMIRKFNKTPIQLFPIIRNCVLIPYIHFTKISLYYLIGLFIM